MMQDLQSQMMNLKAQKTLEHLRATRSQYLSNGVETAILAAVFLAAAQMSVPCSINLSWRLRQPGLIHCSGSWSTNLRSMSALLLATIYTYITQFIYVLLMCRVLRRRKK